MADDDLYFGGYRTPLPGDYIIVYRNDQVVGYIHWTNKACPVEKVFNELLWCYTHGAIGKAALAYSLDDAKTAMIQAFHDHMKAMGCEAIGPSRKPRAEDINWVPILLKELSECKTVFDVDCFYSRSKRRLKEMPKLFRTEVTGAARKLAAEYHAKEHPEEYVAHA